MADNRVIRLKGIRQACMDCNLLELCLPVSLESDDVERLDDIVQRRRPLARGERLYRAEDPFESIFTVRSGALKTMTVTECGEEQVTGFYLPGDIVGLDAINLGRHPCDAVALETTSVCEIPFSQLERLATKIPGLQRQLLRIMSKGIFEEQVMLQAVSKRTAEERLAIFLLNVAARFEQRGLSATRFQLPMSRSDMSNYLGLAPETMSRLFKRFQEQGLVATKGREVMLLDLDALQDLSHGYPTASVAYEGRRSRA